MRPLSAFAVLALLCGVSCRPGAEPSPLHAPARAVAPGVVLICLDTLRADALTTDPARPGPLPTLDAFARTGTTFVDAASNSSWTGPAISSLLTGLLPAHHGVRGRLTNPALSASVPTVAGMLRDRGWSTWAFTGGGIVSADRGFANGFEAFHASFDGEGPEASIARWRRERRADAPFFLFLHTYAAHDPYGAKFPSPPAAPDDPEFAATARRHLLSPDGVFSDEGKVWFLERFLTDPSGRRAIEHAVGALRAHQAWQQVLAWIDEGGFGSPAVLEVGARAREAYRAGLAQADQALARTLAALAEAGIPKDTAIVVVGDHGESFGEHGTLSHGRRLHDELVRIPLAIRAPGVFPAGAVVRGSCSLVDVSATLLRLAGLTPPDDLDGRDLAALARGDAPGRPVVAEEERRVASGEEGFPTVRTTSVRVPAAKYVLTTRLVDLGFLREELYDLLADPAEAHPLPADDLARFGLDFAAAVDRIRATIPAVTPPPLDGAVLVR